MGQTTGKYQVNEKKKTKAFMSKTTKYKTMNSKSLKIKTIKTKTLIIIILDESGSMSNKKSDVLGGFNAFIKEQKKIKNDQARLYLVKFNTSVQVLHQGIVITRFLYKIISFIEQGVELGRVKPLTKRDYTPGGGTALFDAIAEGVRLADRDRTDEEQVVCVIMTDGEENSSKETTKQQIKDIIAAHQAQGKWKFLYIGESPDNWAKDHGMSLSQVHLYDPGVMANNLNKIYNYVASARLG